MKNSKIGAMFGRLGALALLLTLAVGMRGAGAAGAPGLDKILGEADARIEKVRKNDAVLRLAGEDGTPLPAGTAVRIEQTRHEFLFGCNIFGLTGRGGDTIDAAYAERFKALFNFATIPFYWAAYEPAPGDFAAGQHRAEVLADWCARNGLTAKGHPLMWNNADPKWLRGDTAAVRAAQLGRITREVTHFKGKIAVWDGINELAAYDRPKFLQSSPRLSQLIKEDGITGVGRAVFATARRAAPAATLLINDYEKGPAYLKVIDQLKDEGGRPLYDAIGIQAHQHGGATTPDKLWETCERFAPLGKPLHFTEVTLLSGKQGGNLTEQDPKFQWVSTPEGEQRQAEQVARFYTVLFSHPAVEAITWWDFSDLNAWKRAPAGLVRKDMSPKPAYDELMKRIKGTWSTKAEKRTAEGGTVSFRGFRGDYKVTVTGADGKMKVGTFKLTRESQGAIEVRVK